MEAQIILLLALVVSVSATCAPSLRHREVVYAKGHAKVKVHSHDVVKDLRVDLVTYYSETPTNVTVLASANADDTGFYVIAGSHLACYVGDVRNGANYDTIEFPPAYVLDENRPRPVQVFENDIDGVLNIAS